MECICAPPRVLSPAPAVRCNTMQCSGGARGMRHVLRQRCSCSQRPSAAALKPQICFQGARCPATIPLLMVAVMLSWHALRSAGLAAAAVGLLLVALQCSACQWAMVTHHCRSRPSSRRSTGVKVRSFEACVGVVMVHQATGRCPGRRTERLTLVITSELQEQLAIHVDNPSPTIPALSS